MKHFIRTLATLALALMLLSVGSMALAQSAAPDATAAAVKITGTLEGVVAAVGSNDITINMANGNTIRFMLTYVTDAKAAVGDSVKIEYAGDISDCPEAVSITVLKDADELSINGEVILHDNANLYVVIASKDIFSFVITGDTKVTGKATSVVNGDTVKVVYDGDLYSICTAKTIEITKAATNRKEANAPKETTKNKILDGYVTRLSNTLVSIRTNMGKAYSFKVNKTTETSGSYALEVGARINVTYDGYATDKPLAKKIRVLAPPDPTPTERPNIYKTVSGTVSSFYGVELTLTNGASFDCTGASFSGNSCGNPGDSATVVYYHREDGIDCATKVTLNEPQPTPTEYKTASGEVESFGGMYLSLTTGIGFDVTFTSYSGNGNREPGDWANVTYYVGSDGMNYATHVKFTAAAVPAATEEPEYEEPEYEEPYDEGDDYPSEDDSIWDILDALDGEET